MRATEALARMCERDGRSEGDVSLAIGRERSFVNSIVYQARNALRNDVGTGVLSRVAAECGYALVLEGRGERLALGEGGAGAAEAMRRACAGAGRSAGDVSLAIGRSRSFLNATFRRADAGGGGDSGAALVALVAAECGYALVLKGRGERIPIDPAP